MYVCPRCEKQYEKAPEQCVQCKRPLILNRRFQIEISIDKNSSGEDFDVVDLRTKGSAILRELRVRKADAAEKAPIIEAYHANVKRLKGMKSEGKPVLIDAFEAEYKNSRCYYYAFDADAWAMLGPDLDPPQGSMGGGGEEPLDDIPGRDLDPEMEAYLAKLEGREPGAQKKSAAPKAAAPAKESNSSAMVKSEDKAPAKSGSAAKIVIAISLVVIIGAAIAAALMFV